MEIFGCQAKQLQSSSLGNRIDIRRCRRCVIVKIIVCCQNFRKDFYQLQIDRSGNEDDRQTPDRFVDGENEEIGQRTDEPILQQRQIRRIDGRTKYMEQNFCDNFTMRLTDGQQLFYHFGQ